NFAERADEVIGIQAQRNRCDLAVGQDGPRQFILRSEILWNRNHEHSPSPAWKEVSRLAHVRSAWFDVIVRTDGDVEFLLCVAIEISHQKALVDLLIIEPAFKCTRKASAELFSGLGNLLAQQQCAAGNRAGGTQTHKS